jgi:hypothetical protein
MPDVEDLELTRMAVSIFERVRQLKKQHPALSRHIDQNEKEIRAHLGEIRHEIATFPQKERSLAALVIFHRLRKRMSDTFAGTNHRDEVSRAAKLAAAQIRRFQKLHPALWKKITTHETQLAGTLAAIASDIERFPAEHRRLIFIMVVNGLERTAEETLIL